MQNITPNMVVCGNHFKTEDFIPRVNAKRKKLKKNSVPSVNLPVRLLDRVLTLNQKIKVDERRQRWEKRQDLLSGKNTDIPSVVQEENWSSESFIETSDMNGDSVHEESQGDSLNETSDILQKEFEASNLQESEDITDNTQAAENCNCENHHQEIEENDSEAAYEAAQILLLLSKQSGDNSVKQENNVEIEATKVEHKCIDGKTERSLFMRLLKKSDDLKIFCGINSVLLENLTKAVKLYEKKTNQYKSSVQERIVLCLCKLKLNLSFKCLAVLFQMDRHTCSKIFLITLHTLAFVLKDAIYWPSKDEILKSMPKSFNKFKETYIILDCTEIPVERPKCLQCRLRVYSHYKGCETIKFLVGISPSGLIIFISKPYGGRASDKVIFNRSKILEKLEPTRDAIMVDKGFAIETECAQAQIKLIIPPKFGKNNQLSADSVTSTVAIASARVHVERAIQRMKLFSILKSKISQKMAPYMDEVCTVICGLVNLSEPILSDKRFE